MTMSKTKYEKLLSQLTEPLTQSFIPYEEGEQAREKIKNFAKKHYQKRWREKVYLNFIKKNISYLSFKKVHAQDSNYPYVYILFTVPSQHVYGNCFEECVDKAIEEIKRRDGREFEFH